MDRPYVIFKDWRLIVTVILSVAGWAVSYGILLQKVDDQREQISEVKLSIQHLSEKFDKFIASR